MFESYEKMNDPNLSQKDREIWTRQFLSDVNAVIREEKRKYE